MVNEPSVFEPLKFDCICPFFFQCQNSMFDKTVLLLAFASFAATASGQLDWSNVVSITNSDTCAEYEIPSISTCYEIIFNETSEGIVLKGKCAAYTINWSSESWSPWYDCGENDDQNTPCDSPDCMISSTSGDDCAESKPSWGNCWKVNSYRPWGKIILKGKISAFKVRINGLWSTWYDPNENEEKVKVAGPTGSWSRWGSLRSWGSWKDTKEKESATQKRMRGRR